MVKMLYDSHFLETLAIIDNDDASRKEFGTAYRANEINVTRETLEELKDGTKTLAFCDGEYTTFITVGKENKA